MNNRAPNPTDWLQFYESTLTDQALQGSPDDSVLTAPAAPSSGTGASSTHLSPDGRVSKPARRRRASRTAPTTLVNTDTTNFRAMVQQFTGVTNPSLAFGPPTDAQNISFRSLGSQGVAPNMLPLHGYRQGYQQQQGFGDGYGAGFGNTAMPNLDGSSGGYVIRNPSSTSSSSQMFPRSSSSSSSHSYRSNGYIQ